MSTGPTGHHEHVRAAAARGHRPVFAIVLIILFGALFAWVAGRLVFGVIAGLVLWAMTDWIHRPVLRWTRGRRGVAAAVTVGATVLLVIIPVTLIVYLALLDAAHVADGVRAWLEPYLPQLEQRLRQLAGGGPTRIFGVRIQVDDLAGQLQQRWAALGAFALTVTRRLTGGLFQALLLIGTTLYAQFFFCLDGDRFLAWLRRVLPLEGHQTDALLENFFGTSRSTLKAFAILGPLQGGLGGLAFWILGIPAPFFWAVVMALASAIPSVGAQIILVPAALVLVVVGRTGAGLALLAFSWIVIASIDNVLRPVIVRRDARLHELIVFVGSIGGLATFGLFGVFLGPILGALLKASLDIYADDRRVAGDPGVSSDQP